MRHYIYDSLTTRKPHETKSALRNFCKTNGIRYKIYENPNYIQEYVGIKFASTSRRKIEILVTKFFMDRISTLDYLLDNIKIYDSLCPKCFNDTFEYDEYFQFSECHNCGHRQ